MPKCIIDKKEYEFKPGETIIQIADRNKIDIPRFCYHPGLSVVAQCRMCAVEIEKMPKIQTACSTPASDGMVINTKSEKVKSAQASCMEFLLINHPLDCPICDKSGECDLQNYSFSYGAPDSRYDEQRRTFMDLDMGPVIKKNMNRCIHCTRCIRFCDEVSGYREMVALRRGNNTEIVTINGDPLQTKYAGNLSDICPTGSLTLKDFRFKKRVWFLKKTKSICEGCAQGCNIEIHHESNIVWRLMPRENQEINKWWICDEGRFNIYYMHSPDRIIDPVMCLPQSTPEVVDWKKALDEAKNKISGKSLILIGSDLTLEEMTAIQKWVSHKINNYELFHFGNPGHLKASDDQAEDKILRRTSKTSNLFGADQLGLKGWPGQGKYDSAVIFSGGRAVFPENIRKHVSGSIVGVGVFFKAFTSDLDLVLPGLSYVEKSGTIVNWQGKQQKLQKALEPIGQSKGIADVFALWGKA